MSEIDRDALCRRWLHSHEEDSEGQRVYRPDEFEFPPSRGRAGFALEENGSCAEIGIAATDGSTENRCTWELLQGPEDFVVIRRQANPRRLRIISVDSERLVVAE